MGTKAAKVLLIMVAVSVLGAVQGYGWGVTERPAIDPSQRVTFQSAGGARKYYVSMTEGMGATIANITWDTGTFSFNRITNAAVAEIADQAKYVGTVPDEKVNAAMLSAGTPETLKPEKDQFQIIDPKVLFGKINGFQQNMSRKVDGSDIQVPIIANGTERTYRVLLIHKNGDWERIQFKIYPQFFQGEKALFDSKPSLTYQQKAIAFLFTFLTTEADKTIYKTAANDLYTGLGDTFWDIFKDAPSINEDQKCFCNAFIKNLNLLKVKVKKGSTVSLPELVMDSERFDQLYGDNYWRSVYMNVYLRFLLLKGKPLLSYVLDSGMKSIDTTYSYDWNQYQTIEEGEGEELANNALRYLSWGVEYTLSRSTFSDTWSSSNLTKVFASNNESQEKRMETWVKTGGIDASSNYFPFSLGTVPGLGTFSDELLKAVHGGLSTPFINGLGNPMPYACQGIDSPRTFAYKMWEQYRARELYRQQKHPRDLVCDSTAAAQGRYNDGYVDEMEWLPLSAYKDSTYKSYSITPPRAGEVPGPYNQGEVIKPFIPGIGQLPLDMEKNVNKAPGLYNTDKTAGVDAIGLLTGSIAMSGFRNKVYGVLGTLSAQNLDAYYHMQSAGKGRDESGKPVFYVTNWPDNSCLSGDMRLSRIDLERCSVLIPDIHDIRKGDILVGDIGKDGQSMGVVVGLSPGEKPAFGKDGSNYMQKVIVLSVNPNMGRVFLSKWDGGSFTLNPKSYHVRRLLKLKNGGDVSKKYQRDSWEVVDTGITGLAIEITYLPQTVTSHWIPNTGEPLAMTIKVMKKNAYGSTDVFIDAEKPSIKILGPEDYGFDSEEKGTSNIKANKGGSINFCALYGNQAIALATFKRNTESDTPHYYETEFNGAYFNDDGTTKSGCSLTVKSDNLTFTSTNGMTNQFGLVANTDDSGKPRPGDDILLRFALLEIAERGGQARDTLITTVDTKYFAAVYDKKLLWRANLYVDEGIGIADWNNRNPWIEGNEWNHTENGTVGSGGQVVRVPAWTRFYDSTRGIFFNRTQGPITEGAPYTSGSTDSPFAVAEELQNQQVVVNHYIMNGLGGFTQNSSGWTKTTAPTGYWYKYVETSDSNASPSWTLAANSPAAIVDGQQKYAYRPNLSAIALYGGFYRTDAAGNVIKDGNGKPIPKYHDDVNRFVRESVGVDCSGFIQRAASYNGNPYALTDITQEATWADNAQIGSLEGTAGFATDSWLMWDDNEVYDPRRPEVLKNEAIPVSVVPGDIVVMHTVTGIPHVAMVDKISDANGDGRITREEITFIEAASGHDARYRVMDDQTWWSYRQAGYAAAWRFELRRLMQ